MTKRRSLADRNLAAIAADDLTASPAPHRPRPNTTNTTDTTRVAVRVTAPFYTSLKAAYLADWASIREHNQLADWITAALRHHAERTPAARNTFDDPDIPGGETLQTRQFIVPRSVDDQIRAAMAADQRAGRYRTRSAWCREALQAAVDASKAMNGGTLPTPPARLPRLQ